MASSRYKKWADFLFPIGGTVLAVVGMPVAMAQYPDFFNHNRWLLPAAVFVMVGCWIAPLFLHERSHSLFRWAWSKRSAAFRIAALFITATALTGILWAAVKLFHAHSRYLENELAARDQKQLPASILSKSSAGRPLVGIAAIVHSSLSRTPMIVANAPILVDVYFKNSGDGPAIANSVDMIEVLPPPTRDLLLQYMEQVRTEYENGPKGTELLAQGQTSGPALVSSEEPLTETEVKQIRSRRNSVYLFSYTGWQNAGVSQCRMLNYVKNIWTGCKYYESVDNKPCLEIEGFSHSLVSSNQTTNCAMAIKTFEDSVVEKNQVRNNR